jgi:2-polyprenyl-6-hydroxyphenyl methylase/3-demethylubiquinone-9 3-methyltransferase
VSILPRAVDRTRPIPPARVGIDNDYYDAVDDQQWWDPRGPAAILHAINGPRLRFYREALGDLAGRLVLDAGCGGGLVAKGLVEAGAVVVGLDQSPSSLKVARRAVGAVTADPGLSGAGAAGVAAAGGSGPAGAGAAGVAAGRFHATGGQLERLPFADGAFDAVVAADVLEHVPDLPAVVRELSRVLVPGGSLAFDTINRTVWAWFTALWGAERLLGLMPRGTHDWRLLIRPEELDRLLRGAGLVPVATAGLAPAVGPADIVRGLLRRRIEIPEFRIGSDRRASYLGHYRKTGPGEEGVHP